jgi:hypothetical protein
MCNDNEMWYMDTLLKEEVDSVMFSYNDGRYYADVVGKNCKSFTVSDITPQDVRAEITRHILGYLPDGY